LTNAHAPAGRQNSSNERHKSGPRSDQTKSHSGSRNISAHLVFDRVQDTCRARTTL
jgi:hypothetical protein